MTNNSNIATDYNASNIKMTNNNMESFTSMVV